MPVLEHGAGGDRTDIVCGHMYSDDPLFDPAMRAFPPVFVVRVPDGPAARWVASSINYALAVTTESLPGTALVNEAAGTPTHRSAADPPRDSAHG
jgi:Cupin